VNDAFAPPALLAATPSPWSFDTVSQDAAPLPPRLILLVALAPAAIGLAGLVAMVAAAPGPAWPQSLFVAVLALQAAIGLILGVEGARRLRRERAALAAAAAEERRRAARAAETARARLRAASAQEIGVPLAGLVTLIEAVLATPNLPPEARRRAAAALEAGRDLAQLLADLAAMPEAAEAPPEPRPFRVDEVLEGIVTLLGGRAAARGLLLTTAIAPGTAPVWRGEAARLRQILLTLTVNALNMTERGEIRLAARETAAGELALAITDTGRGISAERLDGLFEPFAWMESGVALGLSVCQDLVRRAGGTIAVQSASGRGSTFTVTLPLAKADPAILPPRPGSGGRVEGPALPVLVVDDVAANRLLLGAALARAGFGHAEAADGAAAVALAATRDFAAVLMDVQMPGMDGLEATRRIRALPPPAGRLRVIGITADRTAEGEAAARAAGMDDFLAKPVSVADLARVLAPARA